MRHILRLDGADHFVAIAGDHNDRRVLIDDAAVRARLTKEVGTAQTLLLDGRMLEMRIAVAGDDVFIWLDGEIYAVTVLEPLAFHARHAGEAAGLETRAPMPGNVVALPVAVGDAVQAGCTLVVIESMKLEVSLKATQAGRVADIHCAVGRSFDKDAVLVTLVADEGAGHAAAA